MENTRNKVVFNLTTRERNLTPLAEWLFMGTVNPERVKHELYSRKVMDYEEETRTVRGSGSAHGRAAGSAEVSGSSNVSSHTRTSSGSVDSGSASLPLSWSDSDAQGSGHSEAHSRSASESDSYSESESEVPVWIPVFGEELSSVQFSSVEEQLFLAEQRIMTQPNRHALVRLVGMQAVTIDFITPDGKEVRIIRNQKTRPNHPNISAYFNTSNAGRNGTVPKDKITGWLKTHNNTQLPSQLEVVGDDKTCEIIHICEPSFPFSPVSICFQILLGGILYVAI